MSRMRSRIEKLEQSKKNTVFRNEPVERTACWIDWIFSQPEDEAPEKQLAQLRVDLEEPTDSQEAKWRNEFRQERITCLETLISGNPWPPEASSDWVRRTARAIRESFGSTQTGSRTGDSGTIV